MIWGGIRGVVRMFVYLGNINYLVINIELVFVNIVYFNRKFSKLKICFKIKYYYLDIV